MHAIKENAFRACNKRKCDGINEYYSHKTRNKSVKQSAHCKVLCNTHYPSSFLWNAAISSKNLKVKRSK